MATAGRPSTPNMFHNADEGTACTMLGQTSPPDADSVKIDYHHIHPDVSPTAAIAPWPNMFLQGIATSRRSHIAQDLRIPRPSLRWLWVSRNPGVPFPAAASAFCSSLLVQNIRSTATRLTALRWRG